MSYQPGPLVPPPAEPQRRGRARWVIGPLLVIAGLVGAAVLYVAQQSSYETAITNLQRAASGVSTEFVFEKTGVFTLYYEYQGEFSAEIDGDEQDIELDARTTPRQISLRLLDADEQRVRLERDVPDVSYDVGGFAGSAYRQVEIDDTGSYTLEVSSETGRDEFAIAVGFGTVKESTLLYPALIAVAGVILGLLAMLLLGRRKRPVAIPSGPPGSGPPLAGWPAAPVGPPPAPVGPPPAPTWGTGAPTGPGPASPGPAGPGPAGSASPAPPTPGGTGTPPPSAWPPPPS